MDEKWSKEAFKITEIEDWISGKFVDPDKVEENKFIEKLMFQYNGMTEMIKGNKRKIDFLIQTVKGKTSKSECEERRSAVYFLLIKINMAGLSDIRKIGKGSLERITSKLKLYYKDKDRNKGNKWGRKIKVQ